VCGEESDCEKVFKNLVLETLNYQEWELEVCNGGIGGMLLNVLLCGVECSCLGCQIIDFTIISFRVHVHQVLNDLPIKFGFIE
jgi:hypothetical protein